MKTVYGVGVNDIDINVQHCKFYKRWKSMLERCFSISRQQNNSPYIGCTVCEEWLLFSNFKAWMECQDWQEKELDKDILFPGNKVYSPETCIFVSKALNSFLTDRKNFRGIYPLGVSLHKKSGKFLAQCSFKGKVKNLGKFETPEEAHDAWKKAKLSQIYLFEEVKTNPRIAEALEKRYFRL